LIEKRPDESFGSISSNLKRAKETLGKLNEIKQIYSRTTDRKTSPNPDGNRASLVNNGEYWTMVWDRKIVRMKGSKGIRLLGVLIDNPGRQFHVMDLELYERKQKPDGDYWQSVDCPMLDDGAKGSYRARLVEIREELEEAERFNDVFRSSKLREEMGILTSELARAFGLYSKNRLAQSDAERARVRVTLAVKGAIEKVSKHNSLIGWHLAASVRTGAFCSYRPFPIAENTGN
jgi:non-specific serine/threonine protein kinase